jgi:predicted TIM-barrel fold metal-dependent hydrolase
VSDGGDVEGGVVQEGSEPPPPPRKVIDAHAHIAHEDFIPRSFVDGSIDNLLVAMHARGMPLPRPKVAKMYEKKMQDPLCDTLVAEMDEAGIATSILLAADFSYILKDSRLTAEEALRRHHEVKQRHGDRLEVFGGIDPRWGKDGVDLFERSLREWGFRGLKLYPPCGFSPSEAALDPFYELCDAYGVPALVHIGPTSPALGFSTTAPFLLDEAARRFPRVQFILAHGAVSFTEECAMLCNFRPNVYLDLSAFQGAICPGGGPAAVKTAVSRGVNHKILFGTDWPVFRMQADQKTFVEAVTTDGGPLAAVPERDRDLILCGNVERILAGHRMPERSITRGA